jgi:hypothetical protein
MSPFWLLPKPEVFNFGSLAALMTTLSLIEAKADNVVNWVAVRCSKLPVHWTAEIQIKKPHIVIQNLFTVPAAQPKSIQFSMFFWQGIKRMKLCWAPEEQRHVKKTVFNNHTGGYVS